MPSTTLVRSGRQADRPAPERAKGEEGASMTKRMGMFVTAAAVVAGGLWPSLIATAATSSPSPSPLEGTWVAPAATCEQQKAALAAGGFTSEEFEVLEEAGWDEATCGGMMHGSQQTLEFAGDRLVLYQDGVVGFEAPFRVIDSDTFETGESANTITYEFAIDGDELTIDLVTTPDVPLGDRVAGTVILETAPFTRQSAPALPYSVALPEGWVAGAEADSFESPDGSVTLTIGTGEPEPGQTVEDRVRINRESEDLADCVTDPTQDRPVSIGGEQGILWSFVCGDEAGLAANTIHGGLGYRLTVRAPADAAAELELIMAEVLAGFTFSG